MSKGLRSNRATLVPPLDLNLKREFRRSTRNQRDINRELSTSFWGNLFNEEEQTNPHNIQNNYIPQNNPPHQNMDDRTLKELTAPDLTQQPLCITAEALGDANVSLKSGLIHHLPTFEGILDDPNKFLLDIYLVCTSMKQGTITAEQLMLRAFPFALKGAAKDWLHYLPAGSITSWTSLKKVFLEKYFPDSRASYLKKQISNIEQDDGESLYEYWERFKKICVSYPYHGYNDQDLILYFVHGLGIEYASMLTSAYGGNIQNKTILEAQTIIEDLSASSRHFRTKAKGISSMKGSSSQSDDIIATKVNYLKSIPPLFLRNDE